MSKRKAINKEDARERRNHLLQSAAAGELSLTEGVRQMRAVTGMTQEEFAHHRGVSARVIKEIERDQANPTVATLNRIGELFGLEVAFVPKRRQVTLAEQPTLVQLSTDSTERENPVSAHDPLMSQISDAANFLKKQRHISHLDVGNVWYNELHHQYDGLTRLIEQTKTVETLQQQLSKADILSEQLKNVDVLIQKLDNAETLIVQLKRAESWTNELKKAESLAKDLRKAESLSSQLKEMEDLNKKLQGVERQLDQLNDWKALLDHGQRTSHKKK